MEGEREAEGVTLVEREEKPLLVADIEGAVELDARAELEEEGEFEGEGESEGTTLVVLE